MPYRLDMQFDLTQDFPVGLEQLWTALGRADYVEEKYRALDSADVQLRKFNAGPALIEVQLDRRAPVARDELPAWARLFAGQQQAMHHHTRWRRAGPAEVDVEIDLSAPGLPVRARGTGTVREIASDRTRMTLHFDVESDALALRSSVARLFATQVQRALQADHTFTVDYLRARAAR